MYDLFGSQFIQYLSERDAVALMPEDPRKLAKKLALVESDITAGVAIERIKDLPEMARVMFAANYIRKYGSKRDLKQAELAEKLCLVHPAFGKEAKTILARHALMLGEL